MSSLIVDTEYGKVQGIEEISSLEDSYLAFYGIRYAEPPTGKLRFKDPVPPTNWSPGILDATKQKSGCYEYNKMAKKVEGSDDCLFLNIYTKSLEPSRPRPTMVYIHGGAFQSGSSSTSTYGSDFLLMADIVLVTINYRLGAFGFLSLDDESLGVPGNAGMKDQLMALKFVKANIAKFGGDPDNITLFGHSAGGGSVSWHCVSPLSKGLFKRAIIMSGCVLNNWCLTPRFDFATRLAMKLGYNGDVKNENEILEFLQKIDGEEIVKGQMQQLAKPEEKVAFPFAPCIESYINEKTFISQKPIEMLKDAWSNDIDVMIGGTSFEGLMHLQYIRESPKLFANFKLENVIPSEIGLTTDNPCAVEFVKDLKKIYYSTSFLSNASSFGLSQDELAYCKIKTDSTFWHGLQRIVQGRMAYGASGKTFMYHFNVDSPTQNHYRIRRLGPTVRGVCHADEVSLLTSFASNGNPNDNIIDADLQNVDIKPVSSTSPPFAGFIIDEKLDFNNMPEYERLKIWDKLYIDTKSPLY